MSKIITIELTDEQIKRFEKVNEKMLEISKSEISYSDLFEDGLCKYENIIFFDLNKRLKN
jgi:hypothetical protein